MGKKNYLIVGKLALAGGLLFWLIRSGRLNLTTLGLFGQHQELLVFNFLVWFSCALLLSGLRWQVLLQGLGVQTSSLRLFTYQAIGLFFNTAMPGAVGGDVIKAIYVLRDQQPSARTATIVSLLLDRFFGICGLFIVGVIALASNFSFLATQPLLLPLAGLTFGVFFAVAGILLWIAAPIRPSHDPIYRILHHNLPGFRVLRSVYAALAKYKDHPFIIIKAALLSALSHGIMMIYFWYLATLVSAQPMDFTVFAAIYPLGQLITTIPIAPGGMGIGHTTFDQLFSLVNVQGGADIFNLFILGQLALNCLGLMPFLVMKHQSFPHPSQQRS